ncbi:MAG: sugar porter family MFS transporter [Bryobacteraceae bacterium]
MKSTQASASISPVKADHLHSGYVWGISAVAALGGLLFGYDWVVIGGAKPFYETYFRLNSQELIGWANSCALIGCLIGSILSGLVSDRFGRKRLLILSAALFAISSIFTGWAWSFSSFIAWRITGGLAIGLASNVSPTYIAEVSPPMWRGRLVSLNQLTIVIGILGAQIVNWLIAQQVPGGATAEQIRTSWNGQFGWRWMFTAVAVPSLIFLFSSLFIPESPRWLMKNRKRDAARATLVKIGGDTYADDALTEIETALAAESQSTVQRNELLSSPVLRILGIGVFLAVLQQWSGINVIFNYAEEVYRNAGYSISGVMFNIVITGAINLVFTLVSLAFVDRFGRRPLMLFGCIGIGISHLLIGLAYRAHIGGLPLLIFTLAAIGCYAMSLAPVTWVLISEIFPNRIRGAAVSIAVSALWIASFILTFTFPVILQALGSAATFWLYAVICFLGFIFIWRRVPETKGKTLEQIERQLTR